MRQRFDPLFGRSRSEQLEEMASGTGTAVSEGEKALTGKLAFTVLAIGGVGGECRLLPPPALGHGPPVI